MHTRPLLLVLSAAALFLAVPARAATLVIDDFEDSSSLERWQGPAGLSDQFAAHGSRCLRLDLPDRTSRSLTSEELPADWSSYDVLKFDIYNPSGTVQIASIQIWDNQATDEQAEVNGQSYRGGKLFMNPGWNHYEFMLQEAMVEEGDRPLALEGIRRLRLGFGGQRGELFLDNIRLVSGEEDVSTASRAEPTDCRVVIHNRFTFPELYGPESEIEPSPAIERLRELADRAVAGLEREVSTARMQGYQTHYWRIPLITARVGMGVRSKLVWFQSEEKQKEILEYVISSCNETAATVRRVLSASNPDRVELPEDEVNPHPFYVPDYPPLGELDIRDGYFRDNEGNPVLIFSMLNINSGPLMDYFAPFNHRLESYTVGGGSRYDIETSPVYEAFHKYPGTHRVGWEGWCGHLIKDRWSMGGLKETVVICLESPHIREAVLEYMKRRYNQWKNNDDLVYNIMAYELMYICYCDESQRMFREYLEDKHGSIARVNEIWGTSYGSFGEIRAPETKGGAPLPDVNRAAWYDWARFNARRFTDYLKWNKSEIRKLDPDIPITAGGTSSMLSSANSTSGIDEELIINEVDDVILNESGHSHIFSDLMLSLSERPMPMVEPEMGGAPHNTLLHFLKGKSSVSKWWWARTPSVEYHGMNASSLPHGWDISLDQVAETMRIGLDIRRLAKEITSFTAPEPEAAILYSRSSILQVPPQLHRAGRTPYLEALHSAWEGSRYLGTRIGFVTEKQIAGGGLGSCKLLIVPAVKYIEPETADRILGYVERGGTALVIPESFIFDQYARENSRLGELGITVEDVVLPEVLGRGEKTQNYDQSFSQQIVYGEVERTLEVPAGALAPSSEAMTLRTRGLVQKIDPGSNRVLASFGDGGPALVLVKRGRGELYYLAAPLETMDYHNLLAPLAEKLSLRRPLTARGSDGRLLTGVEVRSVEVDGHYLMYASNLRDQPAEFTVGPASKIGTVRDLRRLETVDEGRVRLGPYGEAILRIEKPGRP